MNFVKEFQACRPEAAKHFYDYVRELPESHWAPSGTDQLEVSFNPWRTSDNLVMGSIDEQELRSIESIARAAGHKYKQMLQRELVELSFKDIFITEPTAMEPISILRYVPGRLYDWHVDSSLLGVEPSWAGPSILSRAVSHVMYLNDDYEGGETEIAGYGKVKPEPGKCVMFPSNEFYPHTGCEVTEGVKYIVVTWFIKRQQMSSLVLQELQKLFNND